MAIDMFIKLDGIPGESTDFEHKNEIEVLSYSHGVAQAAGVTRSSAGSGTNERVTHQDLVISKQMDKASPILNKYCCKGDHIPKIWLYIRRASGNNPITYMVYELDKTIVTSYSVGASQGGDVPMETISLNYGAIKWTYKETDDQDAEVGTIEATWTVIENKEQ